MESIIPGFEIIQTTAKGIRVPKTGIQNPSSTDQESRIQYLGSGIHGVESRRWIWFPRKRVRLRLLELYGLISIFFSVILQLIYLLYVHNDIINN